MTGRCDPTRREPRGPSVSLAGLCSDCGRATVRYDTANGVRLPRCRGGSTTIPTGAMVTEQAEASWFVAFKSDIGPCARCAADCCRYGEAGNPLCAACRET